MKQCPVCDTPYPNEQATCPSDGAKLIGLSELAPGTILRNKYRIVSKLGQGGMGSVYKATHVFFGDERALKVMDAGLSSDAKFVKRFRHEAQAAYKLNHPNIVRVQDFDQAEDGSPFIVMEYVEGISLRQVLTDVPGPMRLTRAINIIRGAAHGLGAAHAQGMVHRDIKPENILLAGDPRSPTREIAKVLDFGIVSIREGTELTGSVMLLTPPYGSPEQWEGMRTGDLDGRSDFYALGVTLYEMLTGEWPFNAQTQQGWLRAHLTESPRPPSRLNRELLYHPGVDELVLKLLAKDRDVRPRDAEALVHELDRIDPQLTSPPVPISTPQKEPRSPSHGKLDDEATVDELPGARRYIPPKDPAALNRQAAKQNVNALAHLHGAKPAEPVLPPPVLNADDTAVANSAEEKPSPQGSRRNNPPARRSPAPKPVRGKLAPPVPPPANLPESSPRPVFSLAGSTTKKEKTAGNKAWLRAALAAVVLFAALGIFLALERPALPWWHPRQSSNPVSPVGVTQAAAAPLQVSLKQPGSDQPLSLSQNDRLLTATDPRQPLSSDHVSANPVDMKQPLMPAPFEDEYTLSGHADLISSVAFSGDGHWLASGSNDKTVKLWDVATGQEVRSLAGHTGRVTSVVFSPDGKILASASADKTIKLWDPATGHEIRTLKGHTGYVDALAFSPDGHRLASASHDTTVKLWDVDTGQEVRTLTGHTDFVLTVAFSPNGKMLASGSYDHTVKLWDVNNGENLHTLKGHSDMVKSVAFSPNGDWLASGSEDQTVRLWDVTAGTELRTLAGASYVNSVAFTSSGRWLVSAGIDHAIRIWDSSTGQAVRTLSGHSDAINSLASSTDGRWLASGSSDRTIKLWHRMD